MDETVKTVL